MDSSLKRDRVAAALEGACPLNEGERVTVHALGLARAVEPALAAHAAIRHVYALHDIGMLAMPGEIPIQSNGLTPAQLALMQTHTTLGEELVKRLRFLPSVVREVVGCHHERWDGSGYPRQLAGHDRPYRDALPEPWALAELDRCAGTHFAPGRRRSIPLNRGEPSPTESK